MSSIIKTIFLSNKQNSNSSQMAIVTLEKKNNNIFGTIKTFNIDNKKNYILGIKKDKEILKQNVILDNNKYNFLISNKDNSLESIGCVLMEVENTSYTPIVWGSDKVSDYKNQIIFSLKENIEKLKNKDIVKDKVPPLKSSSEDPLRPTANSKHSTINQTISEENYNDTTTYTYHSSHDLNIQNINTTKGTDDAIPPYHNEVAIASYANLFESSDEEVEETINKELNKNKSSHPFYALIAEQLDELFETYPEEPILKNLIDNSKWIKIKKDDNKYYVVGIIFEDNDIKYICYGVPGNYNNEPPIELKEYSQWMPTDISNPYDNGYWVMYQDANTGENILLT